MKRTCIGILLLALLLLACVPTPEEEFVVNKGDGAAEEKIQATDAGQATASVEQRFPDRWDAEPVEVLEGFSIAAHAEIITKADGLYPVYQVKRSSFTNEQATAYADAILGKPERMCEDVTTKAEWERVFRLYLDEVAAFEQWVADGKPSGFDVDEARFTPEMIEQDSRWYMEQIEHAPDARDYAPVHDYSGVAENQQRSFLLSDGTAANVSFYPESLTISKTTSYSIVYDKSRYEDEKRRNVPEAAHWQPVTMDRKTAESTLSHELERLNLTDFSIQSASEANLWTVRCLGTDIECITTGWRFTLCRNPGGYPASAVPYAPSQILQYSASSEALVNRPLREETVTVLIDENGLQYFSYESPKEITGIANPNVELLPFEEIQDRVLRALTVCFPLEQWRTQYVQDAQIPLEIYRMLLTTCTVRVKNSEECYALPCWIVFFDGEDVPLLMHDGRDEQAIRKALEQARSDELLTHDVLILNAIDGSILHMEQGY